MSLIFDLEGYFQYFRRYILTQPPFVRYIDSPRSKRRRRNGWFISLRW